MKKWLAIPLVLIIALVMIVGSCGGEKKTTAPPVTTKPPTQTTAAPTTAAPTVAAPTGTIRVAEVDYGWESTDPVYYESFIGWGLF